jgi:excisionase family DNA binding protein
MDKLLRVTEVAERLNISLPRAYELIRQGLLPAVALGRQRSVAGRAGAFYQQGGDAVVWWVEA